MSFSLASLDVAVKQFNFFRETLFLFIWISFFWLLQMFLDICIIFCLFVLHLLIFLRSVTLSGITVLSSNYNWKWKKKVDHSQGKYSLCYTTIFHKNKIIMYLHQYSYIYTYAFPFYFFVFVICFSESIISNNSFVL